MTGRERCDEIMRLIDEALDSVSSVVGERTEREPRMVRQPARGPGSRPGGGPAGEPKR